MKNSKVFTIPNILSFIRLGMIPLIIWLYCFEKNYPLSMLFVVLSGITDVVDGFIARHFNMVSDFGKALDPLADKLTQAALLLCLLSKHNTLWMLTAIFGVCEISKFICGVVVAKRYDQVNSAKWYGKLNTIVIYITMIFLILFPNVSGIWASALMLVCGMIMIISGVLYIRFYSKLLNENKNIKQKEMR